MPPSIDIAIIGAGPQALTLVTHMLQKKAAMRDRFVVIDPAGEWLHQWHHQFAALEIPHLRWPGCNLFVMGGAAALRLGPVARNLFGGRLASDHIVPALVKPRIRFSRTATPLQPIEA